MTSFLDLGVPAPLASVLAASGKASPFPIQRDTLPDSLAGRDLLGRGRTGSGKTIAFAIPLVARLAASPHRTRPGHPRGLVLAPTRELATQIATEITPLAQAVGLRVATIFGGVGQRPQERALQSGVDIVVACPGRLEDLLSQRVAHLDAVEITVLDEADHMAGLGFLPGVTRILKATPASGQRLLFSATLDRGIDALASRFLSDPVSHEVDGASVPVGEMSHRVLTVADPASKAALVQDLSSGTGRRILFTRTKHQAKKLARQLTAAGIPAVDLHGNLSQTARERNLSAFSGDPEAGGVRVLVATDVAARGVHVDAVDLVVHVDPPVEHKAYLHRSGRTARAGASGTVVTIVLPEQRRDVQDLLRKARIAAPLEPAVPDAVTALVGERAAFVRPVPQTAARQGAPKQRGGGGERRGSGKPSGSAHRPGSGRRATPDQHRGSGKHPVSGQGPASGQRAGSEQRPTTPREKAPAAGRRRSRRPQGSATR